MDLVYFVTGLRPVAVSAAGATGSFPNGNTGYFWAHGRVHWENDAILSASAGLGYPDDGAGSNDQGMTLYCEGDGCTGLINHDAPDFFRLVPRDGVGADTIGYGFESMAEGVRTALTLRDLPLNERCSRLKEIDRRGLIATPFNSGINELVVEAARRSLAKSSAAVHIRYDGMLGVVDG